jgi:uracil-DNA glycosylase family 4
VFDELKGGIGMSFQSFSRETRFEELCHTVKHCSLCQRLEEREPVLSKANGDIFTKVLFIAEAPGRLGADMTGVPLFGDQTGDNFEQLLSEIGWRRDDLFVTNAILCNPRDKKGNNSTPTSEEIANCMPYLEMTMELVEPEVVVTLGAVALEALKSIRIHSYVLKEHVGRLLPWNSRTLVPMYHPAPRARVHRSLQEQRADFLRLAELVDPRKGIMKRQRKQLHRRDEPFHDFQRLAYTIVESLGSISYFKLTKLLYLVDLNALERLGETLTGEIYIRQKEGPWPPKLREMIEPLEGREIRFFFRGRQT